MVFQRLVEEDDDSVVGVRLTGSGKGCCCCFGFVSLLTTILLILSVDTVEPLQYGLHYSTWSKAIVEQKTYGPGRYFLGLGHKFITFPRTTQTISFGTLPGSMYGPIRAKTGRGDADIGDSSTSNGGLNITLSVALQYQFSPDHLRALYRDYKLNYDTPFRLEFEETIRQVAASFTQFDYWKHLDDVLEEMGNRANRSALNLHIKFESVQLLEVFLDARFEAALVRTQVEQERKKLAEFELQVEGIRQETNVIRTEANATVQVINATAQADQMRIVQEAEARANANHVHAQGQMYSLLKQSLEFSPNQVVDYVWYKVIEDKVEANLYVGMKPTTVVNV